LNTFTGGEALTRKEKLWVLFSLLYGIVNVAVPFTILKKAGSFAFWNLITAAVLLAGVWVTSGWAGKTDHEGEAR